VADDHVTVAVNPKAHTPVLLDAGDTDLNLPITWWTNRTLQFMISPR
jgi:hypothetical protein